MHLSCIRLQTQGNSGWKGSWGLPGSTLQIRAGPGLQVSQIAEGHMQSSLENLVDLLKNVTCYFLLRYLDQLGAGF